MRSGLRALWTSSISAWLCSAMNYEYVCVVWVYAYSVCVVWVHAYSVCVVWMYAYSVCVVWVYVYSVLCTVHKKERGTWYNIKFLSFYKMSTKISMHGIYVLLYNNTVKVNLKKTKTCFISYPKIHTHTLTHTLTHTQRVPTTLQLV